MPKRYTAEQLVKKFAGKYIYTYPVFPGKWDDKLNKYVTLYEVRGVSRKIRENYNLPEDCII